MASYSGNKKKVSKFIKRFLELIEKISVSTQNKIEGSAEKNTLTCVLRLL